MFNSPHVHLVANSPPPQHERTICSRIKIFHDFFQDCLYNFDTSGKKCPNFLILLSKIAEIHAWNKLKLYKLAPISTQILSVIKSNEQLLTDSQCNGKDYVDINFLLDQIYNANDVEIMVFEPCVLFPPCGRLGGGGLNTWSDS